MIPFNKPHLTGKELVNIDDAKKNNQLSNEISTEKQNKIFFGGLNELRAVAALSVVIHHIEQVKGLNGLIGSNTILNFLFYNLGKASVVLFFVLSGFLISYLLLLEKKNNFGRIDIKKFYLRRVFRIWPLYYFIMVISFFIIPLLSNLPIFEFNRGLQDSINNPLNYNSKTIFLYLSFLPQFANVVVGASQSWSIGIEEQFYLLIPVALAIFNRKIFFILILILSILYLSLLSEMPSKHKFLILIYKFFKYFNFQFLLIGVIGGYLYFYNLTRISNLTKSKFVYILLILLILFLSTIMIFNDKLNQFILGILFMCLILFTINESNNWVFRNQIISYLGKISYGIYMYQVSALFLVYPLVNKYFIGKYGNEIVFNLLLYFMVYVFTILFSILSYEFFESKFIKFKDLKFKVK